MTVVHFPSERLYRELTPVEKARMLVAVIAGLRTLGEPATAEELSGYVQHRLARALAPRLKRDVEAILREYTEPGGAQMYDCAPFRRVILARTEAWAFSTPFRSLLVSSGLDVRLRPLPT